MMPSNRRRIPLHTVYPESAGWWYITTSIIWCPPSSLLFNSLFKMTLVSDDPSWWPTINFVTIQSYFIGSWRANDITQSLTVFAQLHPVLWLYMIGVCKIIFIRAKNNTDAHLLFSPALTFEQEVGWGDSWTEVPISLKMALQLELIWVGRVAHEMNYRLICWTWCRGNPGPLWLSYISVCVVYACINPAGVYWLQDMLGALPCNTIHGVCSRG